MLIPDYQLLPVFPFQSHRHIFPCGIIIKLGEYLPGLLINEKYPSHGIDNNEAFLYSLYDVVPCHYHRIEHAVAEHQQYHKPPGKKHEEYHDRAGQFIYHCQLEQRSDGRYQFHHRKDTRTLVCLYHLVEIITECYVEAENGYESDHRDIDIKKRCIIKIVSRSVRMHLKVRYIRSGIQHNEQYMYYQQADNGDTEHGWDIHPAGPDRKENKSHDKGSQ